MTKYATFLRLYDLLVGAQGSNLQDNKKNRQITTYPTHMAWEIFLNSLNEDTGRSVWLTEWM